MVAFYPANSVGDDIEVYSDDQNRSEQTRVGVLRTLRQQCEKETDDPYLAMSDFVAPLSSGIRDYIGMFACTAGINAEVSIADDVTVQTYCFRVAWGVYRSWSSWGRFLFFSAREKELVEDYKKKNDDYRAIMTEALADRLAEAFAEYVHEEVRKTLWGYAKEESLDTEDLLKIKYEGIRPAPGYPSQVGICLKKKL